MHVYVCVHTCVCARACELNLMSSALRTMRGNKVNGERKQAVIVLTLFWDLVSVWRGKKGTPARSHTCRSQKSSERKKEAGFSEQNAPPLPFPPPDAMSLLCFFFLF